jgi:hypothetical protein
MLLMELLFGKIVALGTKYLLTQLKGTGRSMGEPDDGKLSSPVLNGGKL